MINLKKIVAVGLAATMCMGLGITSFAADSDLVSANRSGLVDKNVASDFYYDPGAQVEEIEGINNQGEKNEDLKTQALEDRKLQGEAGKESLERTLNSINTKQEVLDILASNKVVAEQFGSDVDLKDCSIVPVAVADIYHLGTDGNYLAFKLGPNDFDASGKAPGKYTTGDTVLAMVESGAGTGVWRVEAGKVDANGEVVFETNTTGAVVVIKATKKNILVQMTVDQNGNVIDPPTILPDPEKPADKPADNGNSTDASNGQNTANNNANAAASALTSPKTGEF